MTGQQYNKNDGDIYDKLIRFGSFKQAYPLAEQNLQKALQLCRKPSEAAPACTVHYLVKEILVEKLGAEIAAKEISFLHIVNSDGRILDVYPKILTFIPDVLKYYLNKNKIIQMQT
ncbi:MAG: hypothetical protein IJ857_03815 [Lachnospiraceae bacterium]|nr:hypothetical protein [Lachnospiraceae bacterium]